MLLAQVVNPCDAQEPLSDVEYYYYLLGLEDSFRVRIDWQRLPLLSGRPGWTSQTTYKDRGGAALTQAS